MGKKGALKCVFVAMKWNKFVTVSSSGKTDIMQNIGDKALFFVDLPFYRMLTI